MKWAKGKSPIRDAIRNLDNTSGKVLWHQIQSIWGNAEKWLHAAQQSSDGHEQGSHHCQRVEENLSTLIPEDWRGTRVSAVELFILSAACALHDSGKRGDSLGDHGIVAARRIWDHPEEFGLDPMQAHAVGWLVNTHNTRKLDLIPKQPYSIGLQDIHLRNLTALFCLADTLHCDYTRVLRQITDEAEQKAKENPVTIFRVRVSGCHIDDEGHVWITAFPRNLSELPIIDKGFQWILDNEMAPITTILHDADYPYQLSLRKDPTYLRLEAEQQVAHRAWETRAFPGLDFCREGDVFKGREQEIQTLYDNVLVSSASLLVGVSGVGKTSLVCAGLFPKLRTTNWSLVRCCPSPKQPSYGLIRDISSTLLPGEPTPSDILMTFEHVSKQYEDTDVLIFLDQFEDVLTAPHEVLEDLYSAILGTISGRFANLHVLLAYRAEVEAEVGQLFQQLTGSRQGPPRCNLRPLTREGAEEALRAGFDILRIGLQSETLPNAMSFMDTILNDIEAQGNKFYPPYIQIVGETLAEAALATKAKIVTLELYEELGRATSIIGRYLFEQLAKFSGERRLAEDVLKALVGVGGTRKQKSADELQQDTRLDTVTIVQLLNRMSARRMIRPLGGNEYEIIHDYFAQLVINKLVSPQELETKQLQELLAVKSATYPATQSILSPAELSRLYILRQQVRIDKAEEIMLHSGLAESGPVWFFFRNSSQEMLLPMIVRAMSHSHHKVRLNSFRLLARMSVQEALPRVRELLQASHEDFRQAAAQTIGQIGGEEDLPTLRKLLGDKYDKVKVAATEAIGMLASRKDLPALEELLEDPSMGVRQAAAQVIGQLATPEDMPILRQLLRNPNGYVRRAVALAVVESARQQGLPSLKKLLKDPDDDVRREATRAIAKCAGREALPTLKELLSDPSKRVKSAAARAIGQVASHEDLPTIRELLQHSYAGMRRQAALAMSLYGTKEDTTALMELLRDSDDSVKHAAVQAIGQLGNQEHVAVLKELLRDLSENVRWAVAQAIVKIEARVVPGALKRLINDPDWYIRRSAVQAVGELANREELPELQDLLQGTDEKLRLAAAWALGQLASHDDLPALRDLLGYSHEGIRNMAVETIVKLGSESELSPLAQIVMSAPFSDFATAANQALILLDRRFYCPFPLL